MVSNKCLQLISTVSSIWCMRWHMHASTCATSLMDIKNSTVVLWDNEMKKMKQRSKASNWMIDRFSLIFVILSFAWMLYFHVLYDFRIREKLEFGVNTIISLIYSKYSCLSLLEPVQNNLSNPEVYSEPCQTSKMDCFAKILNG